MGCNSIMNAWLDPTVLGNFRRTTTMEIRASLTLEDTPLGIPGAVYPSPEDLDVWAEDYPILPGDTLAVEIYELRQRQLPYQAQTVVSPTGHVNLPVIGRVAAAQLTVPEFEEVLRDVLKERDILRDPEVTVDPLLLQYATYSIFGIGVSAATNAPLRAGTFPIRRPDLRILEAINLVGGLNEFVTDIYVFRYDTPPWAQRQGGPPTGEATPPGEVEREPLPPGSGREETGGDSPSASEDGRASTRTLEEELIDVVVHGGESAQEPDTEPPPKAVEEVLEPDPTQPYIWVNNEFVPNPVYKARSGDVSTPPPAARDTVVPAVNWARIAGDTLYRVIHIPAEQMRAGNPELNIVVRGGDVIRIVSGEIGVYYVMGQVNRVGAFAFNAEPITLKAAIAAAGGLSGLAWPDRCTVYRRIGQREQMIQVDLDRIFAGADPDFFIRRGDIVNVGTHPFAPFLQRIRALTLPNPASNVGYSFTYARNFADIDSFAVRRNPANEPDRFPALFP
jgi:protein involved in polysaccharide export with SLBB domain